MGVDDRVQASLLSHDPRPLVHGKDAVSQYQAVGLIFLYAPVLRRRGAEIIDAKRGEETMALSFSLKLAFVFGGSPWGATRSLRWVGPWLRAGEHRSFPTQMICLPMFAVIRWVCRENLTQPRKKASKSIWSSLRQLGHKGICVEHYAFDRAGMTAIERLWRQDHAERAQYWTDSAGGQTALQLEILALTGCAGPFVFNAHD